MEIDNFEINQGIEISIPLYAWHNRLAYEKNYIKEYNEIISGSGIGIFKSKKSISLSFDFTLFRDSFKELQLYYGFFFKKNFYLKNRDWKIILGFTSGFTQRKNFFNYAPIFIPPYPIFGVGYKKLSLEFTYLVGPKNFSNILVFWFVYRF
jgi:palmitoyl transferase